MEIWKPIPGHKGYEASDQGNIRSTDRMIRYKSGMRHPHKGRVLKQFTLWNGYKTTHLGAGKMNNYVHHLVAKAFLGKTPKGMHICHDNGDKSDNRLVNLRFDTRYGNMRDVVRHRYEQAWLSQCSEFPTKT